MTRSLPATAVRSAGRRSFRIAGPPPALLLAVVVTSLAGSAPPRLAAQPVGGSQEPTPVELVQAGRWLEAEAELETAVERRPEAPVFHFLLGLTLARLGNPAAAVAELETAVRLRSDRARWWHELARSQADLGRCVDALTSLERAAALAPSASLDHDAASCLQHQGDPSAALERLGRGLERDPEHLASLLLASQLERDLGRPEIAAELAYRALALAPESPEARVRLGLALLDDLDDGDLERALHELERALESAPGHSEAAWGVLRARKYLGLPADDALRRVERLGAERERRERLEASISLAATDVARRLELARLELRSGDASAALRHLRVAVARSPDDPEGLSLLREAQKRALQWRGRPTPAEVER